MNELRAVEEEVFLILNQLRQNPKTFIEELESMKSHFQEKKYISPTGNFNITTEEGVVAIDEAIEFLKNQEPLNSFKRSEKLNRSASKLIKSFETVGDGTLKDNSMSLESRIKEFVDDYGSAGENISFGWEDPKQIIFQLLIDDGVSTKGNRDNFFSKKFSEVGLATGLHRLFKFCCVFDFFGKQSEMEAEEILQSYEIPSKNWPEKAVSFVKFLEVKQRLGNRIARVTYEFKMGDGSVQKIRKVFPNDDNGQKLRQN